LRRGRHDRAPPNVVMTAHIALWVDEQPDRMTWIIDCLARHGSGDWGDLDPDDQTANNHALRQRDGRVLSCYPIPGALVDETINDDAMWIITDDLADADAPTTILWPSDY
jgi:hypothetical protein